MNRAVREIGSKILHRKARNRRYYKKKQLSQIEQNLVGLASNFEEMTIVKDKQFITGYSEIFQETSTFESIYCADKQMEEEQSEEEFADFNANCDYSSENSEEDIENQYDHEKERSKYIYSDSKLNVQEFSQLFRCLCQKLELKKKSRNILLDFIRNILPVDNIVPCSYYLLTKYFFDKFGKSKKAFKICSECYSRYDKNCENLCNNSKKQKSIDALVFDFEKQIKRIIEKNWDKIQVYKSNFH
jgi:hypothetical protein